MQVKKIKVENFRLLKNVSVDLERELSLIIGKNNCGKTSFLVLLDKFLSGPRPEFSYEDFSVSFLEEIKALLDGSSQLALDAPPLGISLKVFIEYSESDSLANIGNTILDDLDVDNNVVVLSYIYHLPFDRLEKFKVDHTQYKIKREEKAKQDKAKKADTEARAARPKDIMTYFKENYKEYFVISHRSLPYDMATGCEMDHQYKDLDAKGIRTDKILSFKSISAKRGVSNKASDKSLSELSLKIYQKLEKASDEEDIIEDFKDTLTFTDGTLNGIYDKLFTGIMADIKKFGGAKPEDTIINIISTLQRSDLLQKNTTVVYKLGDDKHVLPEHHNGLGYMNLIGMIFELKIILREFERDADERPADINLLFIEEPEVHTHPQMQCIFIRNIKSFLKAGIVRKDGIRANLQTVITTHSSHIVSESDFNDIKYFQRQPAGVVSKNLKDLEKAYHDQNEDAYFKFLKQYLTLHRSVLFFADKAIFVEGDTERILLPAMMRQIDELDSLTEFADGADPSIPLLSQNISVMEVGAYAHIFEKFIDFVGVKSLVVTDLDPVKFIPKTDNDVKPALTVKGEQKFEIQKCPVAEGKETANSSLSFFFEAKKDLAHFTGLAADQKMLSRNPVTGKWVANAEGYLRCAFQLPEAGAGGVPYTGSSFEDAFFNVNDTFIRSYAVDENGEFLKEKKFVSLSAKYLKQYIADSDPYKLAQKGITRKPSFAIEVLLLSISEERTATNANGENKVFPAEFANWIIPEYIAEGLRWLKRA
ncbi:ATP-dependent endonuclease [Rhizobium leguminosarum]|uniref:ATP-dependent nuclease n=1 Tax=Rhizobium leguminosarum TaxID=384 RepID=UPI0010324559|nr:ATP-dependent endonuclease [Rhizobium leguminosarum]TAY16000.1 ATP-dependent endonuclease [Rhizobium leguminosarum]